MSAGFEPSMIGAVVKVVTTNLKDTEIRTVVGRLVAFYGYERTGENPTTMAWFQIEGEPDARTAFDECHSSEVEALAMGAADQQAMIVDELQQLRATLTNGDLFMTGVTR